MMLARSNMVKIENARNLPGLLDCYYLKGSIIQAFQIILQPAIKAANQILQSLLLPYFSLEISLSFSKDQR